MTTRTVVKQIEQDQQQRDAVDPEVVIDIERFNPRRDFDKLHAGNRTCRNRSKAAMPPETRRSIRRSASQRATAALWSANRQAAPQRRREWATTLRWTRAKAKHVYSVTPSDPQKPPRQQHEYADDHGKGIVVNKTRLKLAGNPGEPTHQPGGAIHKQTVDNVDVTETP